MAKSSSAKKDTTQTDNAALYEGLSARYTQSYNYFQRKRTTWEDSEKLFNSVRADKTSDEGVVTDGSITTLIIERAARVTSQIQSGIVKEVGMTSSAAATVVDLIVQHDILPNANSGNPHQTKLFQAEMGADIYGTYPVLYGLNVTDNCAYADYWLIKPQLYYPQPGKTSTFDMQWAQVETTVTVGQLKAILSKDATTWDKPAIEKLIAEIKEGSTKDDQNDLNKTTYGERNNYDSAQLMGKGDYAPVTLRTEYQAGENGRWITYVPTHDDIILRNTPNPHKNGKIPIVHNTAIPQFEELYGISTMERGKTIQKTLDSFTNLGYQNALLNVLPITKVKTGTVIESTLAMKPGAVWRMSDLNGVEAYTTGNVASEYFQTSISSMRSILLNQNGTTDTMLNAQTSNDQSFGKTKSAIDARSQKQNARDNLAVRMYDQFYGDLITGLIDVKLNSATKPVQINLEKDEIAKLLKDEEVAKLIEVKGNTVTINLKPLKDGKYKYVVESGSSLEADTATEHSRLDSIIQTMAAVPQLVQMAMQEGYEFSAGELLARFIQSSGTNNSDEIIHKKTDEELAAEQQQMMEQQQAQMQQQAAQAQPQDPNAGQPMQDPGMQQGQDMHPFVQHLAQDPQGAMDHLAQGAY